MQVGCLTKGFLGRKAKVVGLYANAKKRSIMFSPPTNKTRCLFTVWDEPGKNGGVWLYVAAEAFTRFFNIPTDTVVETLGGTGWTEVPKGHVPRFGENLERLLRGATD